MRAVRVAIQALRERCRACSACSSTLLTRTETFELAARQAGALNHTPLLIGNRQLEHVLGKIHSNNRSSRSSIHLGLSLAALR